MNFLNKIFSYLKDALSEPNGNGSSTRLMFFLFGLAFIAFGIGIVYFGKLPDLAGTYIQLLAILTGTFGGFKLGKDIFTKDSQAQGLPDAPKNAAP